MVSGREKMQCRFSLPFGSGRIAADARPWALHEGAGIAGPGEQDHKDCGSTERLGVFTGKRPSMDS